MSSIDAGRSRSASWELTWEVHNLLAPTRLGTSRSLAVSAPNATDEYGRLGTFDRLEECQAAAATAAGSMYSFTWFLPSHRSKLLRGACYAVNSRRWEPVVAGEVVSGRRLCREAQTFVAVSASSCSQAPLVTRERRSQGAICMLVAGGRRPVWSDR